MQHKEVERTITNEILVKKISINIIKNIILNAILMLDDGTWNPSQGGEYVCQYTKYVVTFYSPSRFRKKTSYVLLHPFYGKWAGYLNGASHKVVGIPKLQMSTDQINAYRKSSLEDPQKLILEALLA